MLPSLRGVTAEGYDFCIIFMMDGNWHRPDFMPSLCCKQCGDLQSSQQESRLETGTWIRTEQLAEIPGFIRLSFQKIILRLLLEMSEGSPEYWKGQCQGTIETSQSTAITGDRFWWKEAESGNSMKRQATHVKSAMSLPRLVDTKNKNDRRKKERNIVILNMLKELNDSHRKCFGPRMQQTSKYQFFSSETLKNKTCVGMGKTSAKSSRLFFLSHLKTENLLTTWFF